MKSYIKIIGILALLFVNVSTPTFAQIAVTSATNISALGFAKSISQQEVIVGTGIAPNQPYTAPYGPFVFYPATGFATSGFTALPNPSAGSTVNLIADNSLSIAGMINSIFDPATGAVIANSTFFTLKDLDINNPANFLFYPTSQVSEMRDMTEIPNFNSPIWVGIGLQAEAIAGLNGNIFPLTALVANPSTPPFMLRTAHSITTDLDVVGHMVKPGSIQTYAYLLNSIGQLTQLPLPNGAPANSSMLALNISADGLLIAGSQSNSVLISSSPLPVVWTRTAGSSTFNATNLPLPTNATLGGAQIIGIYQNLGSTKYIVGGYSIASYVSIPTLWVLELVNVPGNPPTISVVQTLTLNNALPGFPGCIPNILSAITPSSNNHVSLIVGTATCGKFKIELS